MHLKPWRRHFRNLVAQADVEQVPTLDGGDYIAQLGNFRVVELFPQRGIGGICIDARERAALAWADAVNALPQRDDTDAAYPALREQFNETEIAELGYVIAAIRGWNVLNISLRNQIPEVPAPGF